MSNVGARVTDELGERKTLWMLQINTKKLRKMAGVESTFIEGDDDDNTPPWVYPFEYEPDSHTIFVDEKEAEKDVAQAAAKRLFLIPRTIYPRGLGM